MQQLWSWDVFFQELFAPDVLAAVWATVIAAVLSQIVGTILGLIVGAGTMSRSAPVRWISVAYVEVFRGTPLLIQLLAFYVLSGLSGLNLPVLAVGVIAIGTNEAAYLAESVRSGLMSVEAGQQDAARTLGMGRWSIFRRIVLPQAAPVIIPPLGTSFNSTIKVTSLLSFISYQELVRVTTLTIDTSYRPFEIFAVAAIYYLALTTVWSLIQAGLERRFSLTKSSTPAFARVSEQG
jgi:polar amino acid transport system permease protein